MDFIQLVNQRFSVRKYNNKKVDRDTLLQIMEAARLAPSAVNFQPWHFIIIQNDEGLAKIHRAYNREWIKTAPVVIIACADRSASWKRSSDGKDFGDIDLAISIDHLTLRAAEMGLGTCWVCNFETEICKSGFKLPEHIEPVALIPVGFPENEKHEKKRKPIDEIVHWEEF